MISARQIRVQQPSPVTMSEPTPKTYTTSEPPPAYTQSLGPHGSYTNYPPPNYGQTYPPNHPQQHYPPQQYPPANYHVQNIQNRPHNNSLPNPSLVKGAARGVGVNRANSLSLAQMQQIPQNQRMLY